jgi:hypothetical protein
MQNADHSHRSILYEEVETYGFESVHWPASEALQFWVSETVGSRDVGLVADLFDGRLDSFSKPQGYSRQFKSD